MGMNNMDSPGSLNDVLVVGQEISAGTKLQSPDNRDPANDGIDDSSPYYKERN